MVDKSIYLSGTNPFTKLASPLMQNQSPTLHSKPNLSTPRRNTVKRNLNKSFDNVHDYSIVEPVEQNSLKVVIRKSNRKGSVNCPKVRKSIRNIPRKSYAEYVSPLKSIEQAEEMSTTFFEWNPKIVRRRGSIIKQTTGSANSLRFRRSASYCKTDIVNCVSKVDSFIERAITNCKSANEGLQHDINYCESLRPTPLNVRLDKLSIKEDNENYINVESGSLNESFGTTLRIRLEKLNIEDLNNTEQDFRTIDEHKHLEDEYLFSSNARKSRISMDLNINQTPYSKQQKSNTNIKPTTNANKTPKNKATLIRKGLITPSMQSRSRAVEGSNTPLMTARSKLHVSYVPKTLPCREKEYADVFGFLRGKLHDGCGGCMYISGVPGTGKTVTINSVLTNLQRDKSVPNFNFIKINGMRLAEPRQTYVEILKQLKGKVIPWEQAQNELENIFIKGKDQDPTVILIDELDILCTKRQDVVYNLLDWPNKAKRQLIVVTIANTMDLPERLLMSRVTSRLGLTRLTFQAYTYKQLQDIVTMRLYGTDTFNPDAVQFVARKVASVSGDARRALDICRRAAEIVETEGKSELVNMTHVNIALNLMITQPKVQAIRHCSILEQLILQSIVSEVERTGVEETNLDDVYKMLPSHAGIEGFRMVSTTLVLTAVAKLAACRLILTDPKCNNIHQRIVLNVSVDDVFYALKSD